MDPEPLTPTSPRPVRTTVFRQAWLDLTFVHWALDPDVVMPLLPDGVRPDVLDGTTQVGLVAFRMRDIGIGPLARDPLPRLVRGDERAALHGRRGGPARGVLPVPGRDPAGAGAGRPCARGAVPVVADVGDGHRDRAGRTRAGGGGRARAVRPAGWSSGPGRRSPSRARWSGSSPPAGDCTCAGRAGAAYWPNEHARVAAAPGRAAGPGRRPGRRGRTAATAGCTDERAVVAGGTGQVRAEAGGAGGGQAGAR